MALQSEIVVAGVVPAASTASSPSQPPVLRQGLLRKLKTMKKRYFVLRGDAAGCTARLEYYASEKKFKDGKGQPRKAVELCSCLGISATASSRASFAIALHTRDDCLTVGFDTEKERDDWLASMHQLVERRRGRGAASAAACGSTGSDSDANNRSPLFEHVWMINLRPKGLGRGLAGIYRLCLTDRTLSLVKRASSEANLTFPLEVMRRCGHTDNFFFVEVGRQASTGEGELWMEAEDALIAQSAHYAVQRAMRGANTNTSLVSTSTSASVNASSAVPTVPTGKTSDGTTGDRRHGSVGSSGRDSNTTSSPPRYPETAEPPSPAQSSRFSTNAMSLLTRRFSSKSKLVAAPTVSLPYTASSFASGVGAAAACDDDRTICDSAALAIAEKGGQATSSGGLQLDRSSAAASIMAASDHRTNGSSSSRASCHEPGDLLARSGSPVPAIEITGACKDGDDPYMEMSIHDTSSSLSPVACADYMEMAPVPRFTCDGQESALAASLPSPDANYLSMQPRTPTSIPRRDSLTGIGGASPSGRMSAVAGAAPPRSSLTPSLSPRDAAVNNGSPMPPRSDTACVATGSSRPPALKKGGSQQQLLPDLFNLMPGGCCTSGASSGNAPPASPGITGTTTGYSRSPTGSTSSCHSVSAGTGAVTAAAAAAPAFRSTASLSVPLAQWSEADNTGSSRLRTGSDAPRHRDKLAKQRSDGLCNGDGESVSGIRTQPSQRQRSSSHGCVVSSLDSLHRSRLNAMLVTSARGQSESASSSIADSVGLAASLSPDRGSFEYVAMDFSEAAAAVALSSSGGGSQIALAGASASATAADRKPLLPQHISDSAASGVGIATAVAPDAGSGLQDCGGDYIGIDFRRPPAAVLASTRLGDNERTRRLSAGIADGPVSWLPEGETLLSEPFPELSCSPPPASAGSSSAATAELPPMWPMPPRRSPLAGCGGTGTPSVSLSTRSRSRDSSLSFADGGSHVVGGGGHVSMLLASDGAATCDDPYVLFNGAIATRFAYERSVRLLADTTAEACELPCDGYPELDLSASGRQLSQDGRPLAVIGDACTDVLQPVPRVTAAAASSKAVAVADIREPPSAMATAVVASAAPAGQSHSDSYADSYAVMNFSVTAHPVAAATPPPSTLSAWASGSSDTSAAVGPALAIYSTRERLDSAGQAAGSGTRLVPHPVAPAAAAAGTSWPGSADDRVGPQHGNTKTWDAAAEGQQQQQRSAVTVALATPKIAMPVRATCYIKDDDHAVAPSADSAGNRRMFGAERAPQPPGVSNGQHVQSLKSSSSRTELGRETTACAAGLRKARPGSVASMQTSAVSPSATPPQRLSPPLPQQAPPPLPPHDRLPAAAVGPSTVKQRHTSGRSNDLALVDGAAAAPSTIAAAIVYATLDLEKAPAGPAIGPPRSAGTCVGAATSARPSLVRPSSGGSLATADSSGTGGNGIVIPRPQSVAGGSVQYSRIDFARLEALKAGKT